MAAKFKVRSRPAMSRGDVYKHSFGTFGSIWDFKSYNLQNYLQSAHIGGTKFVDCEHYYVLIYVGSVLAATELRITWPSLVWILNS